MARTKAHRRHSFKLIPDIPVNFNLNAINFMETSYNKTNISQFNSLEKCRHVYFSEQQPFPPKRNTG